MLWIKQLFLKKRNCKDYAIMTKAPKIWERILHQIVLVHLANNERYIPKNADPITKPRALEFGDRDPDAK